MDEVWKEILNFDDYMISNKGVIKSFKRKKDRIMKYIISDGYYAISLVSNNETKILKKVHKILAELFIENPNNFKCVDHIDTDRLNNDLSNLRWCTHVQNSYNRNKINTKCTSKYKGVCQRKSSKKWIATVGFEGKTYNLGYFATEIEATLAYNVAALKFFKQFAKLNIIDE